MRPTTAIQRPDLGAVLYEYLMNTLGFVMPLVLPVFETPVQSAEYPIIPREAFLKLPNLNRAARAAYYRDDANFETDNFACTEKGLEVPVDDKERILYARFFEAEEVATQRLASIQLRAWEKRGCDLLSNTSTFTNGAATAKWNVAATAKPRADVQTRVNAIRQNTGIMADTVILSENSFQDVLNCADFQDHVKYTSAVLLQPRAVQEQQVASYLGVNKLRVVTSVYDSAKKGKASVIADIWTNTKVMVCKTTDNPRNLKDPCVGRTFLWTEESPDIVTMESYRDESIRSDIYRGRGDMAEKTMAVDLGQIITATR